MNLELWLSVIDIALEHSKDHKITHIKFVYLPNFEFDTILYLGNKDSKTVLLDTGISEGVSSSMISKALELAPKLIESAKKRKEGLNLNLYT
jgi:hypothetical protein